MWIERGGRRPRRRASAGVLLTLFLAGCASPVAGSLQALRSPTNATGPAAIACGSYTQLARYWSDHLRGAGGGRHASGLTVHLADGRAEITLGAAPAYYGLIELQDLGRNTTRVTGYAGAGAGAQIEAWRRDILRAQRLSPDAVSCPAQAAA